MKTILSLALVSLVATAPAFAGTATGFFIVTARVEAACAITQSPTVAFSKFDSAKGSTLETSAGVTCTRGTAATVHLSGPSSLADGKGNTLPYTITDANGQVINAAQGPSFTSATGLAATHVPMTVRIPAGSRVPDGDYSGAVLMTVDF
jgi:spore coat protein U-like protein